MEFLNKLIGLRKKKIIFLAKHSDAHLSFQHSGYRGKWNSESEASLVYIVKPYLLEKKIPTIKKIIFLELKLPPSPTGWCMV